MCDKKLLSTLCSEAKDQRKKDWNRKWDEEFKGQKDEIVMGKCRHKNTMAIAYSMSTGRIYVGYSSLASRITSHVVLYTDWERRIDRVDELIPSKSVEDWKVENCAEVAALNNAIASNENVGDLVFIAFWAEGGIKNPCGNCYKWIDRHAHGWFDFDGQFHISTHQ